MIGGGALHSVQVPCRASRALVEGARGAPAGAEGLLRRSLSRPRASSADVARLCGSGHAARSAAEAGREAAATAAAATARRRGYPALVMAAAAEAASVRSSRHAVGIFTAGQRRAGQRQPTNQPVGRISPPGRRRSPSFWRRAIHAPRAPAHAARPRSRSHAPSCGRFAPQGAELPALRPVAHAKRRMPRCGGAARRRDPLLFARHPDEPRAGAAQGRPLAAALDPLLVAL